MITKIMTIHKFHTSKLQLEMAKRELLLMLYDRFPPLHV